MSSREGTPDAQHVDNTSRDENSNTTTTTTTTITRANNKEENDRVVNPDDIIDMDTFEQLLEMDDEDDHDFSYGIVDNYFEQAEATFTEMDVALQSKDLTQLSHLGHFLKGSSAAIGLKKVKATCEKIQNIGKLQDDDNSTTLSEEEALQRITPLLPQVKIEYAEAEEYLKNFYEVQDK